VSDQIIRVTARPRDEGLDIDRLAQALLEFVSRLTERQRQDLAEEGKRLIDAAEQEADRTSKEGAA